MTPEQPPAQQQTVPGTDSAMEPAPDYGESTYRGTGRLEGKKALITGADSGIGKAVALAFAREGADVAISYLDEHGDAEETQRLVEDAGRQAVLIPGDLSDPAHCRDVVAQTVEGLGSLDVLVSNAAFQMTRDSLEDIPDEEWDFTWATNVSAYFHLVKAALPHLKPGASIIATSSIQADQPSPALLPYAATKAAMASMTASLAQMLGDRGIRANSVAPGPIWTPLIPATMPPEKVDDFGADTPLGRVGQPAELAPIYVLLASDESSYVSGAMIPVTGGRPIL
jgi:NAD(P)-dependent dehydrogenase (short-subunit alcohol dehydrogenase family)